MKLRSLAPLLAPLILPVLGSGSSEAAPAPRLRPVITVEAVYPGFNAAVVADTVAAPIEEQINGLENLGSMISQCTSEGTYTLHLTFKPGTDLNIAHVLVQNRVALAQPVLPDTVQRMGVTVKKYATGVLLIVTVHSPDGSRDPLYLSNYASIQVKDELARLPGVGEVFLFRAQDYGLRIWLDPDKLAARKLIAADVTRAIEEEKSLGRPLSAEQYAEIVLKTNAEGQMVRLRDVGRIELGANVQRSPALLDGKPAAALGLYLSPQAQPQELAAVLRDKIADLRKRLPAGVDLDATFHFAGTLDPEYLLVEARLPAGDSVEHIRNVLERCTALLMKSEGVQHVLALPENPYATFRHGPCLLVLLAPLDGKRVGREQRILAIRSRLKGVEDAALRLFDLSGPGHFSRGAYPVDLAVSGPEQDQVRKLAENLVDRLNSSQQLTDVAACPGSAADRQVVVDIDRTALKTLGVSMEDLTSTLQVYLGSFHVGNMKRFGRTWQVQVQVDGIAPGQTKDLKRLQVRNARGQMVPLSALVTLREVGEPGIIQRLDGRPMMEITGNPAAGLSLAEARGLCEAQAEEARQELRQASEYRLTWLQELPAARPAPVREKSSPEEASPPEVSVALPVVQEVTDSEDFTGRTQAVTTIDLRARVSGFLDRVTFKEGSDVKKGELLFEIDPRPYDAALEQARAALVSAQAAAALAEATYKRALELVKNKAATAEELDRSRGEWTVAKARVAEAEAKVRIAQLNRDYTRIVAPSSGRIGRSLVDPGNLVKADDTLLATIVSLDPIHVYFAIDERTVLGLRRLLQNQKVKSIQEAQMPIFLGLANEEGYPRQGTINFVNNRVDPDTGTLQVRALFPNPDAFLSPGLFVRLHLPIGAPHKALLVPEAALVSDQGLTFVYVVDDQNKVVYRRVSVGARHAKLRVIETGLKSNERIIRAGLQRVRPGMIVKPHELPVPVQPAEHSEKN